MARSIATLLLSLFLLASSLGAARSETVSIEQAWAAYGSAELEGYLTINNTTSSDVSLTKVEALGATVTLHSRDHQERFAGLYIPIHSELFMQPGGVHVAIMGINPVAGDSVPMTIQFAGREMELVALEVLGSPEQGPEHHSMH